MGKFTGGSIDLVEYDLIDPVDYRPDPEAPGLSDEQRHQMLEDIATGRWVGVVPEPSQAKVTAFFAALRDVQLAEASAAEARGREHREHLIQLWREKHSHDSEVTPPPIEDIEDDLERTVDDLRREMLATSADVSEVQDEMLDKMREIVAEFTDNTPGVNVLRHLRYRPLYHFIGWLSGNYSPEALRAASQH